MAVFDVDLAKNVLADSRLAAVPAEIAIAQVDDYRAELFPQETEYAEAVVERRAREFSTGRLAARTALERVGIRGCEIPQRERRPVWPPSVVGSIAHTRTLAAAIAGPATGCDGLGIDIETTNAVSESVADRVLTAHERDWLPAPEWRTMAFSAKEAIYKAVNPLTGEFLGFRDVELDIEPEAGAFRARCRRSHRSSVPVASGHGCWARYRGHWLVVFVVPRDTCL